MFTAGTGSVCVIVEDIASAIRVGKVTSAHSLLGTSVTTSQLSQLGEYDLVIIWLDSDGAGRSGATKLRRGLSLITETAQIVTNEDPKMLTEQQIRQELSKWI